MRRGDRLHVFLTAIGDAPERVLVSTIDMTVDWTPSMKIPRPPMTGTSRS
jgi:hypothetical protein